MKMRDLVASPGIRPLDWQSAAPAHLRESPFTRGMLVEESEDLHRVVVLPRRPVVALDSPTAGALVHLMNERYGNGVAAGDGCECRALDPRRPCITRLLPVQALGLYEMGITKGLVANIPVGGGKTNLGLLAILALDVERAVLLVPSNLLEQLWLDYNLLRQHFRVPSIALHGSIKHALNMGDGLPTLHVMPYEHIQRAKNTDWLRRIQPQAIIADECDKLKDITTSTTIRVLRYFEHFGDPCPAGNPDQGVPVGWAGTRFCGWTGSLTDQSVMEYWHLLALALRERSPAPLDREVAEDWGRALDARGDMGVAGALMALCSPGENVRHAWRRRLTETEGVVVTLGGAVVEVEDAGPRRAVDLSIQTRPDPEIPPLVAEALARVRNGQRPDSLAPPDRYAPEGVVEDEELIDEMAIARCAQEVACGMFYRWIFPNGEPVSVIKEWFAARKLWNSAVREKQLECGEFLDSAHLLENAARRHHGELEPDPRLPNWDAIEWPRWAQVKDLVVPATQAVWLSEYLVEDAAEWAHTETGIVWYGIKEWGRRLSEVAGLPLHDGGPKAGPRIRAERGDRSIVASLKSHGRGRDGLQRAFHRQLIGTPPSSATMWEQCLDAETEVLTRDGWRGIDADWSNTEAAAYDIETGAVTWSPAAYTVRALGGEQMYGIASPHLDVRVTAGHRMIVERAHHASRAVVTYRPREFVTAEDMPLVSRIPVAGYQDAPGAPLTDDELTFLGLFLTDGNLDPSNNTVALFQSERYPEVIAEIERVIASCGFHARRSVNTKPSQFGPRSPLHKWVISYTTREPGKRGWSALATYIDKEFVPEFEDLTRDQLRVLLHGMWLGDGNKTPGTYAYDPYKPHTWNIATRRTVVAERIQALCVRRGMRCNVSTDTRGLHRLHVSPEDTTWSVKTRASDARPVWAPVLSDPAERVWCVTVSTGAIITRRRGKCAIVGNCLGRLHRRGQKADGVRTFVYQHTPELAKAVDSALKRAEYVSDTLGASQKILAGWRGRQ